MQVRDTMTCHQGEHGYCHGWLGHYDEPCECPCHIMPSAEQTAEETGNVMQSDSLETARHIVADWLYSGRSGSGRAYELLIAAIAGAIDGARKGSD